MLELNLLGFQIILKFKWIVFIYNPTAPLTVKAQVYITGTGGVAHAGWAGVLCRWDEKDVIEGKDGDILF